LSKPAVEHRIRSEFAPKTQETGSGSLPPSRPIKAAPSTAQGDALFFVNRLFGPLLEVKPNFLIEIRMIWPKDLPIGKGRSQVMSEIFPFAKFSEYYQWAVRENSDGYGVFLGINPRPEQGRKSEDDIRDIVALWVDIDAKNFKGGKEEARKRILEFRIQPNLIIDSGNGFHAYWVLEEPVIDRTGGDAKAAKQTMVGLARALYGDHVQNLDRIMRLPGTLNTKDPSARKPVRVIHESFSHLYSLGDLEEFRDYEFSDFPLADPEGFQGTNVTISNKDIQAADADIKGLKVPPRTKRMIITGVLPQAADGKEKTRSERDMSILCSLIAAGYGYDTAKAVFFNKRLGCSDRILEDRSRAEQKLRFDFSHALDFIRTKAPAAPEIKAIREIKSLSDVSAEEKLRRIRAYIVGDIFGNVGPGYINAAQKKKFVFIGAQKMLLETGSDDFKCFLRDRYDIPEKDMVEVLAGIDTKIWGVGVEIEPYNFARYDSVTEVLYISNHDNSVFRLDGDVIQLVDNGTDGVIFEYKPEYATVDVKPPFESVHYFDGGFNWNRFKSESLLFKHLIDLTSFAVEEKHNLQPEEQRYLLTLYFYSLFFESILEEKPIICWTGVKASGKGLSSTAIGKILFGQAFMPGHLPDDLRDFQVALIENYYLLLDNVDSLVRSAVTDALCRAATGERISKRKLYTDSDELKIQPRVFLSITSRDPRFKRDDLVDRLMIFNTAKVKEPKSRAYLFKSILEARPALWMEILPNLNSIVRLLREKRNWNPPGIFRIADWELWGKKVHDDAGQAYLTNVLEKMNREKALFGLEDDPLYILLRKLCFDEGETINGLTAAQLHAKLSGMDKDFEHRYKTSIGLGKRLNNILEELGNEFSIQAVKGHGRTVGYFISARGEEE
jgi:hypothetical protein